MDKNQGYAILKAVMLENGRGFALGEHPTAPSRYVTWACYDDKDGQRQYEWGHYDRVCIEHELSVIQNPCQHSKGRFLHYGQWIGERARPMNDGPRSTT